MTDENAQRIGSIVRNWHSTLNHQWSTDKEIGNATLRLVEVLAQAIMDAPVRIEKPDTIRTFGAPIDKE